MVGLDVRAHFLCSLYRYRSKGGDVYWSKFRPLTAFGSRRRIMRYDGYGYGYIYI